MILVEIPHNAEKKQVIDVERVIAVEPYVDNDGMWWAKSRITLSMPEVRGIKEIYTSASADEFLDAVKKSIDAYDSDIEEEPDHDAS